MNRLVLNVGITLLRPARKSEATSEPQQSLAQASLCLAAETFEGGPEQRSQERARALHASAPGLLARAQRIGIVCAHYGVPIGAAAIRFVLRHPAVTAVVIGARDATGVIEDVSYLTAAVPAELFDELAG